MELVSTVGRGEARRRLAARLAAAGVEEADREAMELIATACGLRSVDWILDPESPLGPSAETVEALARRREAGEPLTRNFGRRGFWNLELAVTPDVLDPRADSETIVEAALAECGQRRGEALRIVDFGIGSGALLAALLKEFPAAEGVGVDLSPKAASVAAQNLAALGLADRATIRIGRWGERLAGPFDLIVSNPPYIRSGDIAGLAREVREHDPKLALDGGGDGLEAYRGLAPEIARLLASDGRFFVEIGRGQGDDVRAIFAAAGLAPIISRRDLAGVERVVGGRLASGEPGAETDARDS